MIGFIDFKKNASLSSQRSTDIYDVIPKRDPTGHLGQIRWYPAWRRYCFYAGPCIFDAACMQEITDFIKKLMEDYKNAKV